MTAAKLTVGEIWSQTFIHIKYHYAQSTLKFLQDNTVNINEKINQSHLFASMQTDWGYFWDVGSACVSKWIDCKRLETTFDANINVSKKTRHQNCTICLKKNSKKPPAMLCFSWIYLSEAGVVLSLYVFKFCFFALIS